MKQIRSVFRYSCAVKTLTIFLVGGLAAISQSGEPVPVISEVVVNPDTPGTVTAGIQEALDSLPAAGGVALLPIGVHEVHARIYMKPDTQLRGYGAGSVIKKDPGKLLLLAEDVPADATQNYVVVESVAGLMPGMDFLLGEKDATGGENAAEHVYVKAVEGQKVFLNQCGPRFGARPQPARPWHPTKNLRCEKQAALYNGFMLLRTSQRNIIANLSLDGNREEQKINGETLYREYPAWWIRLRCAPYVGGDSRIENCRVFDAAQAAISLGSRATVFNCDVSHSFQGIHPGAGPYSRIIQNTVHHNDTEGIYMCWGNCGVIISQNHIYANGGAGIGQLGRPCPAEYPYTQYGRSGDRMLIISDNVIYHNGRAAILDSAIRQS